MHGRGIRGPRGGHKENKGCSRNLAIKFPGKHKYLKTLSSTVESRSFAESSLILKKIIIMTLNTQVTSTNLVPINKKELGLFMSMISR